MQRSVPRTINLPRFHPFTASANVCKGWIMPIVQHANTLPASRRVLVIPRWLMLIAAPFTSVSCAPTTGGEGCAPLQKALALTSAHPRTSTYHVDDPTQPGLPVSVRIDQKAWSKDLMGRYQRDPDAEAHIATGNASAAVGRMEDCTLLGTGELAGQRVQRYAFRLTHGPGEPQVLHVDVNTGRAVYQQYAVDAPGGILWRFDQDVQEPDGG